MDAAAIGNARRDALNIFIIAGEESGDRLGGAADGGDCRAGRRPPVAFTGVGGHAMARAGPCQPVSDR